jgi:lipid II:glycine glycyltransferase (peptidoglycan interpeptide bridge formation enzyme)
MRIKGIPALITPPWALFATPSSATPDSLEIEQAMRLFQEHSASLIVWDLPPNIRHDFPPDWNVIAKHTRQLQTDNTGLFPSLPKHRQKQIRKAKGAGIQLIPCTDVDRMLALHQLARHRKNITSDASQLHALLTAIFDTPFHSSYVAVDAQGNDIANAVFLHHMSQTIYAFGGQQRSQHSAIATTLLISKGIEDAQTLGHDTFDFGGSEDRGVDQFYSEFGAVKVPRLQAVLAKHPFRKWLKLTRRELFK